MARLSPPCHSLYCRIRLFDRRTRRHPPLSTGFCRAALGICHSRRLSTQRRRQSDPSGTSPTRSPQCADASSSRSPEAFRDALAAIRRSAGWREFPIIDAVRLTGCGKTRLSFRDGPSGPGPEPMNTSEAVDFSSRCSWIPGSRAKPAPRNDDVEAFFRSLLSRSGAGRVNGWKEVLPDLIADSIVIRIRRPSSYDPGHL